MERSRNAMENRSGRGIPPQVLVPTLAAAFMLLLMAGVMLLHLQQDLKQIRESRLLLLSRYAEGIQLVLGEAMRTRGSEHASVILRNLAPAGSPVAAALLDDQRRVLVATSADWAGRPLVDLVPQADGMSAPSDRPGGGIGSDGQSLHWFVPMVLPRDGAMTGFASGGWLYLGMDISQVIGHQTRGVLTAMLWPAMAIVVGSVLFGWWLYRRIRRPLRRLHRAVGATFNMPPIGMANGWQQQVEDIESFVLKDAEQRDQSHKAILSHRQRLHLALQCTRAMLHATTVQQAFDAVCRAAVDSGLVAARIGRSAGSGQRLEIVAQAGRCDHLPDSVGEQKDEASDPLVAAVFRGEFMRIELTASASSPPGWQLEAARNGCVEAVAVPIVNDQRILGGLMLMCREAERIDDAAAAMLLGIGADLGHLVQRLDEASRLDASRTSIDNEHGMLRALLDSIPDLIFFKDRASIYLGCNRAFEQLVGRSERDLVGGSDFDLFEFTIAEQFRKDDAAVLTGDSAQCVEEWVEYPDGSRTLLQSVKTPYRDGNGHILGLVGISRDITAQHASEQALRDERALFVAGPTVVFRWAPEPGWHVRYVSPNVQQRFGYSPVDLLEGSQPFADLLHPDDLQRIGSEIDAGMADPDCSYLEQHYRLRHADGRYRWVYDLTTFVRDEAGGIVSLQGYLLDVTETREAGHRLGERVKELRGLYGIKRVLAGETGNVDAKLQDLLALIPPSFQFPRITAARLLLQGRTYTTPEFAETEWLLSEPVGAPRSPIGRIEVVYLQRPEPGDGKVFLDEETDLLRAIAIELAGFIERQEAIGQRRRSMAELEMRERRFRAASESSRDLIYEYDPLFGKRVWFGDVGAALGFDGSHNAGLETGWLDRVHPEDVVAAESALTRLRDSSGEYDLTYRVQAADGSWRVWKDRGKRVGGLEGNHCVVGSCADITEIVSAARNRTLIEKQLKIADRMGTLGLLTRGIIVELNNKLMPIVGFANIAQHRLASSTPEKIATYLGKIQTAANQAAELLDEVNRFGTTSEPGDMAVAVRPMIEKAIKLLRSSLPAGIDIRMHIDPGLPPVMLAPADLVQVILNLCINMQQAAGDQGLLSVRAQLSNVEPLTCSICRRSFSGQWVEIVVASDDALQWDRGDPLDIDANVLDDSKVQDFGMAALYRVVSTSGGHVVAEGTADDRYRFRVFLTPQPAARKTSEALPDQRPGNARIGQGRRVLVVDDDPAMGELLSRQLEQFGFAVDYFDSTPQAFQHWRNHASAIDLIVTDQNMPINTGVEFTAMVRESGSDVPVLLCSGFALDFSAENIAEFGPNGFLARPYSLGDLDDVLGGLFPGPASQ